MEKEIRHARFPLCLPQTLRPLSLLDDPFPRSFLRSNTKMMIKGRLFSPSHGDGCMGHKHLSNARQMITAVVMEAKWPAVPVVGHESKSSQSILAQHMSSNCCCSCCFVVFWPIQLIVPPDVSVNAMLFSHPCLPPPLPHSLSLCPQKDSLDQLFK